MGHRAGWLNLRAEAFRLHLLGRPAAAIASELRIGLANAKALLGDLMCPVCGCDAGLRHEGADLHVDCRRCGGPFVLTPEAEVFASRLSAERRLRLSAELALAGDARVFTEAFCRICLDGTSTSSTSPT
jgi:hypothetical protein